jgi:polysaccharide chain length determinant protein (PEP-CTERM system associated)
VNGLQDLKPLVMLYARGLWRRRWYAVIVAWLFCAVGWTYVSYLPNVYQANTRIYVDSDSVLRPLLAGIAINSNLISEVDLMTRTLFSRPNLEKVAHAADLDLKTRTPDDVDRLTSELRGKTAIGTDGRNLYTIAYSDTDRAVAKKVVQSFVDVFVDSNLGRSRVDMNSARGFIDDQIADYSRQLDAAEKKVAEFRAANIGYLPGENSYAARYEGAKEALAHSQADLADSLRQRDELAKQIADVPKMTETVGSSASFGEGPPIGGGGGAANTSFYDPNLRVAQLQQKLSDLLETYTDQWPDVIDLKRRLQRAQEEADKQNKPDAPPIVGPKVLAPNPVYEQLTLQMVGLETSIAKIRSAVQRNQEEVQKWQGLAQAVPEVGAQMAKLTRDYDVIRKAYEDLLSRREAAKIGNEVDTKTQTVKFRIIDPPDSSPTPVAPKRGLLLSMVLLGGIGAGIAFAFALCLIDDSVKSLSELRDFIKVPVLGAISTVTAIVQPRGRLVAQTALFGISCLALVAAYIGILSMLAMKLSA